MSKSKSVLVGALSVVALSGCNAYQFGLGHVPHAAPIVKVAGWTQPATPDRYGTWTFDPAVDNGCNEHELEVAAEVDNDGHLCTSVVP